MASGGISCPLVIGAAYYLLPATVCYAVHDENYHSAYLLRCSSPLLESPYPESMRLSSRTWLRCLPPQRVNARGLSSQTDFGFQDVDAKEKERLVREVFSKVVEAAIPASYFN